ncbi:glycerophosphodiester phosphodiesterase [Arachnia propionica]|uniref:Glycerophosphodiester phosphodiesterase n=1 Tax=Arachnia propionica TaxID=1750 RepID=A0A3P1TCG6_9ACTN|nr:glycerophosphodiester phosphodiesterase [Arachnia propionica]MDO5082011.1 glycerophosphodiester phosphodiesterase [Arachnia propionica]RRD07147.1 glycerophosphodiester phosphodiesterase [Arachnia propionica]
MAEGYLEPEFAPMAHRGGALLTVNLGIENTLAAFRNAVELGYTYLETDVHATSDHVPLAFHDPNLARVTDIDMRIGDLPHDAIKEIRVGGREPIPRVEELLEEFPEARFNFDIKAPQAIEPLARVIERCNAAHRVCVASFSQRRVDRFRKRLPSVTTAFGPVGVVRMVLGTLPRRRPGGPAVFQIPVEHRVGGVRVRVLTPGRVRAIHRAGFKVHVWTIDVPGQMHTLLDWGVDGIVTDRPDLLKQVLQARGMWARSTGT